MVSQICKALALFAVLFGLASAQVSFAAGSRGGADDVFGPRIHLDPLAASPDARHRRHPGPDRTRAVAVSYWNQIARDASVLDHTPVSDGDSRIFGEQVGPVRTSYALAIVHIAIFDAVNAIAGGYESYTELPRARPVTSVRAAIAQAAYDTLVFLIPRRRQTLIYRWPRRLRRSRTARPSRTGSLLGIAPPMRYSPAGPTTAIIPTIPTPSPPRSTWNCNLALIFSPVIYRGCGAKTQSAWSPSHWV